jgi:hypothetical protein
VSIITRRNDPRDGRDRENDARLGMVGGVTIGGVTVGGREKTGERRRGDREALVGGGAAVDGVA